VESLTARCLRTATDMEAWRITQQIAITLLGLRRRRGLTQNELAKKMGISQSTVTYVESGKGNPTIDMLLKFANHFEIPLHQMFWNSRAGVERLSGDEVAESRRIRIELRTLQPMQDWEFELKYERQIIIKIKGGYAMITADYFKGGEFLNSQDYFVVAGGGFIKIKGIDEIPSELTLVEMPRAEGR
jgi:putative transcriptional regulator